MTTPQAYRWALTPRSDLLDLCEGKPEPIAFFASQAAADGHGRRMYGEFYEVTEMTTEAEEGKPHGCAQSD